MALYRFGAQGNAKPLTRLPHARAYRAISGSCPDRNPSLHVVFRPQDGDTARDPDNQPAGRRYSPRCLAVYHSDKAGLTRDSLR